MTLRHRSRGGGTTRARSAGWLAASLVLAVAIAALAPGLVQGESPRTLVVDGDADGDDHYETIQAALDVAEDGEIVLVQPGSYVEQLTIRSEVVLRAPRGAVLGGAQYQPPKRGISVSDSATIDGFTLTGFSTGISVEGGEAVSIRNTLIQNGDGEVTYGITGGPATVRLWNVTVTGHSIGILGFNRGHIRYSEFRRLTGPGVNAFGSDAVWLVSNTTFADGTTGVTAKRSSGDWEITNSTFRDVNIGVLASNSSGDWTIEESAFEAVGTSYSDGAVVARETSGVWRLARSTFRDITGPVVEATGATRRGDATRNWWGSGADPGADCLGNVDCGDPQVSEPSAAAAGAADDPPPRPTPTPWPTPTPVPISTSSPTTEPTPTPTRSPTPTVTPTPGGSTGGGTQPPGDTGEDAAESPEL